MSDDDALTPARAAEELSAWLAACTVQDQFGRRVAVVLDELRRLEQAVHPLLLAPALGWQISEEEQAQFQNAYRNAVQAHQIVRHQRSSYQDMREYRISALHDDDVGSWVQVEHCPCLTLIFGQDPDGPDGLDADELLSLMATHRCDPERREDPGGHHEGGSDG